MTERKRGTIHETEWDLLEVLWAKERAIHHGYAAVRQAIDASHGLLGEVFANHGIELRPPPARPQPSTAANVDMRESRGERTAAVRGNGR